MQQVWITISAQVCGMSIQQFLVDRLDGLPNIFGVDAYWELASDTKGFCQGLEIDLYIVAIRTIDNLANYIRLVDNTLDFCIEGRIAHLMPIQIVKTPGSLLCDVQGAQSIRVSVNEKASVNRSGRSSLGLPLNMHLHQRRAVNRTGPGQCGREVFGLVYLFGG